MVMFDCFKGFERFFFRERELLLGLYTLLLIVANYFFGCSGFVQVFQVA